MKTDSKRARMGGKEKGSENNTTTPGRTRKRRADTVKTRARTLKDVFNVTGASSKSQPGNDEKIEKSKTAASDSSDKEDSIGLKSPLGKRSRLDCEETVKETESEPEGRYVMASLPFVKCSGKGPSARWGHTLCMVDEGEAVLIGGQGDKQHISKDSVWQLNLTRGEWRQGEIISENLSPKPEHRMGHTATYDPMMRCIYLFGGSKNLKWFNDMHILDLDDWKWQVVKADGKAPTRAYHSTNLYRHELWIFGGVFPQPMSQPDGNSNDIHVFSPIEKGWYSPIIFGEKPVPKSGHSATLLGDQLVVFGGWDAPVSYNELEILDLVLLEWTKPKTNGRPPSPRSWHASCALSGNRILIHGGYSGNDALEDSFIFNLATMAWTSVKFDTLVTARTGHTSLCLPYKHDNGDYDEVLIFGGGDNEGSFFQDLFEVMVPFEDKSTIDVCS